jgi:phospholipase/lecithinase/hemolysin
MYSIKLAAALMAAAILFGCGGDGDPGIPLPKPKFTSVVSFGDSLSDVGSYSVGTVKSLGGGRFTVNSPDAKIWIEVIATRLGQSPPCAAQTGLNGDASQGYFVPITNFAGCTAYAQGGARVTDPVGPGNRSLGGANAVIGELTVPVATQITTHLAAHGARFNGDEAVFVMAGGNDLLVQLAAVARGGKPVDAIGEMAKAGLELVLQIRSLISAGAKYIVVVNLPDVSKSPLGLAQGRIQQELMQAMAQTFNAALRRGVQDRPEVLYVDAYARSRDQSDNPVQYGLTNTTTPACDLSPTKNPLDSSLVCTTANVIPGAVDRYQFADTIHPTPYGHQLLADLVSFEMTRREWLQ